MIKIFEYVFSIGHVFKRLYSNVSESTEMIEILQTPHEINDIANAKELTVDDGKIEFKGVTYKYIGNQDVFDDISFLIKPGEKVAFVGQSGAGKSTILKLLFRFFDIQKGKILIDGQDVSQVNQESLRYNISIVPQEPILFHRNIKENIRYGRPDASDEEVIRVSKIARCHQFITKLENGYDTLVGERGIKLSGGERQRIAIARAILENKKILVLDEATSSLDSESEQMIQKAIEEVMKNKTCIVIAHRLSTIMEMDRIVVIENGKVSEDGTHKELLKKQGGIYKKLRDIQSGGFIS